MTYQAVYKLIHKEFGVKHIDELSPKQNAEAIEYLAGKVIEGEFIGKQEQLSTPISKQFTDEELISLSYLWIWMDKMQRVSKVVYPAMKQLDSSYSGVFYDMANETRYMTDSTRELLIRETANIDMNGFHARHARSMLDRLKGKEELH